mmetsp:Transcript_283/g.637  ORF Transcript_283/g.637 Transcript_283/m.637 type:complete len:287 (-) Transcript_283:284-1144(-)
MRRSAASNSSWSSEHRGQLPSWLRRGVVRRLELPSTWVSSSHLRLVSGGSGGVGPPEAVEAAPGDAVIVAAVEPVSVRFRDIAKGLWPISTRNPAGLSRAILIPFTAKISSPTRIPTFSAHDPGATSFTTHFLGGNCLGKTPNTAGASAAADTSKVETTLSFPKPTNFSFFWSSAALPRFLNPSFSHTAMCRSAWSLCANFRPQLGHETLLSSSVSSPVSRPDLILDLTFHLGIFPSSPSPIKRSFFSALAGPCELARASFRFLKPTFSQIAMWRCAVSCWNRRAQ